MRQMIVAGQVASVKGAKIKTLRVLPSGGFEAEIESS
jgi:hypothetical protein